MRKLIKLFFKNLLTAELVHHPKYRIAVIKWKYVSLRIRTLKKYLLYSTYTLILTILITSAGLYFYFSRGLPTLDELIKYRPNITTTVWSYDGKLIGEYAIEKRYVLPIDRIPKQLIQAFIAAEDARFFEHPGLDFFSILRAFIKNLWEGDVVQGGSTITQQVAKSLLSPEKTLKRKAKEAILAYRIEKNLSKNEILHLYLNQIYLGHGAYGVQAAAKNYFHKDVSELSLAEISTLAGLPQAPSKYSPAINPGKAKERQLYVLYRMLEEGFINIVEATDAMNSELKIYPNEEISRKVVPYFSEYIRKYLEKTFGADTLYREGLTVFTTVDVSMQRAAQKALRKGLFALDKRQGYRGPEKHLKIDEIESYIKTIEAGQKHFSLTEGEVYEGIVIDVNSDKGFTIVKIGQNTAGKIDIKDMRWARKPDPNVLYYRTAVHDPAEVFSEGDVIKVKLVGKADKKGYLDLSLFQEPEVQGAMLSIDPENGFVKMMVGGFDFEKSKFNRAVQSLRQPGSAFKPIIYSAALDKGYTPSSIIVDAPLSFRSNNRNIAWRPQNYDHRFHGPTTLRKALVKSRNIVTIKIVRDLGLEYIIDYAKKMGIKSALAKDLSLSLGSSSLTLLELTSAYSLFPAGGKKHAPVFITKIIDRDGKIVMQYETAEAVSNKTVNGTNVSGLKSDATGEKRTGVSSGTGKMSESDGISPQTAYIMTSLLQGVVQHGTGWRARSLNRPVGGKTGTTNDYIDAWFIGFTPDLVTGTWVGFDDRRVLGKGETGSNAAAPLFVDYMANTFEGKPVKEFPVPAGIEFATIDEKSGLLAYEGQKNNTVVEAYKKGTAPAKRAKKRPITIQTKKKTTNTVKIATVSAQQAKTTAR